MDETETRIARWRGIELGLVFLALPILVAAVPSIRRQPLLILAVVAVIAACALVRGGQFERRRLWRAAPGDGPLLTRMVLWWLLGCAALVGAVALWLPEQLFHLPRQQTARWAELLLLYPLVSVVPQELLYRAFFFHRYRSLLGEGRLLLLANAAAFAVLHVVFHNVLAVVLTFLAGLLFAHTYRRSGHLPLVLVQHVLYGWAVFSVGLEPFFLGAAWRG